MHARYYGVSTGRFISVDPIEGMPGSSQSWNPYCYVLNSPVNANDPGGEIANWIVGAIAGAAIGFAGNVASQVMTEGSVNWRDAAAAGVGGAVSGAVAGATLGVSLIAEAGVGGAMLAGAAGNLAGGVVERALDSSSDTTALDGLEMIVDAKVGAVGAGIGQTAGSAIRTAKSASASAARAQLKRAESALSRPSKTKLVKRAAYQRQQAAMGRLARIESNVNVVDTVAGAKVTGVLSPLVRSQTDQNELAAARMVPSH